MLVDGDLAINSMMWQNAGKSGLDQWNFTLLPTSSSQVCAPAQSRCPNTFYIIEFLTLN